MGANTNLTVDFASVSRPVLAGKHVRLSPLTMDHLIPLWQAGGNLKIWEWNVSHFTSKDDFQGYINHALSERDCGRAIPWVIEAQPTGMVVGSTRFGEIVPRHQRAEIGWSWIHPDFQRTGINTEMKYLMLKYGFEILNLNRIEFKTDALNWKSRNAILRLGAIEEGILRGHMVTDSGRRRDTIYFSILRDEWGKVRSHLENLMARRQEN